jgi:hypothetical protein
MYHWLRVLVVMGVFAGLLGTGIPAQADCAADPDAYTLERMIRRGDTGDDDYERLFLGRVRRIRDPEAPGGNVIVRLRVREVPFGPDRSWVRIRDWMSPPGMQVIPEMDLVRGRFYAVVAHERTDGTFFHDGPCGQTQRLHPSQLRRLIHLSRHG